MRGFWISLGIVLAVGIVVLPIGLVALVLQSRPLVVENTPIRFHNVEDAKALMERYDPRRMAPGVTTEVRADESQLNTALAAALTAFPRAKAQVAVEGSSIDVRTSLRLPIPQAPFGRFLNLKLSIGPSEKGFAVRSVWIGRLPVPAALVKPTAAFAIDQLIGPGKGAQMLASVRSLSISGKVVTVAFRPPPTLVSDIKHAAQRGMEVAGMKTVRLYYGKLIEIGAALGYGRHVSLADFLGPSFALAKSRSAFGDPVEENRALILALAVYFGDDHFARLLTDVTSGDLDYDPSRIAHVYVQNRNDWVQHFVTSAGLTVAGGTAFATLIGEAKEVTDTQGAEGFSFGDLAADRTGVRLGEVAVQSDASARKVQKTLSGHPTEAKFFPPISDLPEDLTSAEFKRRFGDVDSPAYKAELAEIDRRIAKITLYK